MTIQNNTALGHQTDQIGIARLRKLAPRPRTVQDTGLTREFLGDLLCKHLLNHGTLSLAELARLMRLSGSIIENILEFIRSEARVEVRPARPDVPGILYALTDRGRSSALDAMLRSGYVGPAPVPLHDYSRITRRQSIHARPVSRDEMHRAFENVVLDDTLVVQLGASMNSGRAVLLYGSPGTGKTFVSRHLTHVFPDATLVPHAIAVGEDVVQLFDPLIHKTIDFGVDENEHVLERGHDPRFLVCERPAVVTGGELTAEMLEVDFEPSARTYEAPLQLKANNGVFVIDDLGRQRVDPRTVFNRWIVPLEEKSDFLHLQSGRHFSVPFDVVLIFSTNIHPLELGDEAFLRRIGYKIRFSALSPTQYEQIWRDVCFQNEVDFDPEVLNFVINELHGRSGVDLLPCHPRDLIGMAVDQNLYAHNVRGVDIESIRWAWSNYFVSLEDDTAKAGIALPA